MDDENRTPRIIETASATTSKDNENSGPFAYIITVVAIVLLIVFCLVGVGCTSVIVAALSGSNDSYGSPMSMPYGTRGDDLDSELEDLLERYYNMPNDSKSGDSKSSEKSNEASVAEVLDFSLAPYGTNIEGEVGANSYAGAPAEVRDFVRNVVEADEEYTRQLVVLLNNAANKEDDREAKIKEAMQLCSDAQGAFDQLQLPALEKDQNGEVADQLGTGKTNAINRWKYLGDEIALLDTMSAVNTKRLWEIDDKVVTATTDAGDSFESAMFTASKL